MAQHSITRIYLHWSFPETSRETFVGVVCSDLEGDETEQIDLKMPVTDASALVQLFRNCDRAYWDDYDKLIYLEANRPPGEVDEPPGE